MDNGALSTSLDRRCECLLIMNGKSEESWVEKSSRELFRGRESVEGHCRVFELVCGFEVAF